MSTYIKIDSYVNVHIYLILFFSFNINGIVIYPVGLFFFLHLFKQFDSYMLVGMSLSFLKEKKGSIMFCCMDHNLITFLS